MEQRGEPHHLGHASIGLSRLPSLFTSLQLCYYWLCYHETIGRKTEQYKKYFSLLLTLFCCLGVPMHHHLPGDLSVNFNVPSYCASSPGNDPKRPKSGPLSVAALALIVACFFCSFNLKYQSNSRQWSNLWANQCLLVALSPLYTFFSSLGPSTKKVLKC